MWAISIAVLGFFIVVGGVATWAYAIHRDARAYAEHSDDDLVELLTLTGGGTVACGLLVLVTGLGLVLVT